MLWLNMYDVVPMIVMKIAEFTYPIFIVNSEANRKRIQYVEQCFGSSGQVRCYTNIIFNQSTEAFF